VIKLLTPIALFFSAVDREPSTVPYFSVFKAAEVIPQGSIYWKICPPPGGKKYQPMSFWGENIKCGRGKGKCKIKKKKGGKKKRTWEVKG
jgi:hypothetical protein